MSTRSGRIRPSAIEASPPRARRTASQSRSPARARKSSPPSRSPSRKSASRKSPSRKPASKFPARKSPSRTTTKESEIQKSPGKRLGLKSNVEVKLVDVTSSLDNYRSTRGRRSDYSLKDISSNVAQVEYSIGDKVNGVESVLGSKDVYGIRNRKPIDELVPRRSSRLREFLDSVPDISRSLSKSISKSVSKSISQSIDYSDQENSDEEVKPTKRSATRKLATPIRESVAKYSQISSKWDFGGRFGSLALTILIPSVIFAILISCSKTCTFKSLLDLSIFKTTATWFSLQASLIVVSQVILQAIFALLPVCGRNADRLDGSGTKYCFNALFSSIMTITILFTLDILKIMNWNTLLEQYFKLATVSFLFALLLAIALYVKSHYVDDVDLNSYGNTGYISYDFFIGREVHPYIKRLNVKVWISRISNITTLILAVVVLLKHGIEVPAKGTQKLENVDLVHFKELLSKVQLKPTVLLYSIMQIVYVLNFIVMEHKVTSTFFWQCEGIGYLQTVASFLYPFYFTSICKFIADSNLELSTTTLVASAVLYLVGYFVMVISNNVKHEFRLNPLSHRLTNYESMPTFHGKKLIVSGFWGVLRHPNYAGDILIHIALALPGLITQHWLAAAPGLLTVIVLLHRASRDHSRCSRRYGAAWQRYCKRVPAVIIPKLL